jgi:tetratricopeptide (TPR) repeat protein
MKFFGTHKPPAKGALLMAAIVASSILIAAQANHAKVMPERRLDTEPPPRTVMSANELLAPHKAQTAAQHAREDLDHKRFPEAKKHLEQALEIYPNYALALQLRGLIKLREDRLEEACADFEQVIQFDPNLGAAYVALGATYNRLGQFQKAILPLGRAVMILPKAWTVHYETTLAYLGTGEYEAALRAISQAEENNPVGPDNRSSVFYTKGRVLLALKDYPGAKAAFEQSINEGPKGHFAKLSEKLQEDLSAHSDGQELPATRK